MPGGVRGEERVEGAAGPRADGRSRPRGAALALVSPAALIVLGAWGHLDRQHFVWVDRLFDHVWVFGVLAVLLAALGLGMVTGRRLRRAVWVPALVVAALWALYGALVVSTFGSGAVAAADAAPGGSYRAVARSSFGGWEVAIQQTRGLTAREFSVGCIDLEDDSLRGLRWADAEHLVVRLAHGSATVRVDPRSGRPVARTGAAWRC